MRRIVESFGLAGIFTIAGWALLYGFKFSLTYGPVWRYYVFYILGSILILGIGLASIRSCIPDTNPNKVRIGHILRVLVLLMVVLTAGYSAMYANGQGLQNKTTTHLDYPMTSDMEAYEWVQQNVDSSAVVLADAVDSSYLLAFSDVRTVTGHYGHTNPVTENDRDASVILWSSNYSATIESLEDHRVSYIFVDEDVSGIFEAGLVWFDLWRGPQNEQPFQYNKFDYFGDRVYHNQSSKVSIYRISRPMLPDPDSGFQVSLENRSQWHTDVVGGGDQYRFTANGSLELSWRPHSENNVEMASQRRLTREVPVGEDGVFVYVRANYSRGTYPHLALHYHDESSERVSVGWVDQFWRNADVYYRNGKAVYETFVPSSEIDGRIDAIKLGAIQSEFDATWRRGIIHNVSIIPVGNSTSGDR